MHYVRQYFGANLYRLVLAQDEAPARAPEPRSTIEDQDMSRDPDREALDELHEHALGAVRHLREVRRGDADLDAESVRDHLQAALDLVDELGASDSRRARDDHRRDFDSRRGSDEQEMLGRAGDSRLALDKLFGVPDYSPAARRAAQHSRPSRSRDQGQFVSSRSPQMANDTGMDLVAAFGLELPNGASPEARRRFAASFR